MTAPAHISTKKARSLLTAVYTRSEVPPPSGHNTSQISDMDKLQFSAFKKASSNVEACRVINSAFSLRNSRLLAESK